MKRIADIQKLVDLVERLRGDHGCPWDKEQTRETLKPMLVEEAYEVLDALDSSDPAELKEELGTCFSRWSSTPKSQTKKGSSVWRKSSTGFTKRWSGAIPMFSATRT